MAQVEVERDEFFEGRVNKDIKALKEALENEYSKDRDDILDTLAEALEIDVEDLPKHVDVEVRLSFGKKVVSVSGFIAEEKEDEEDE